MNKCCNEDGHQKLLANKHELFKKNICPECGNEYKIVLVEYGDDAEYLALDYEDENY